jgi:ABC-type spermidine/putrescine transport system permease subunit II
MIVRARTWIRSLDIALLSSTVAIPVVNGASIALLPHRVSCHHKNYLSWSLIIMLPTLTTPIGCQTLIAAWKDSRRLLATKVLQDRCAQGPA